MPNPTSVLPTSALYEQVADQLRARILARELAPGAWIDEQALAAELGISRTPLREALKVLAAEGLVAMKLRRGAYVAEVTPPELAEIFHVLGVLESDAAAAVAEHASDTGLAELAAIHAELETTTGDRDAFFAANERFHRRLLELAGNRWRQQIVTDLRRVMKLTRHQSLQREGRIAASLDEHRRILAALQARDAASAQALTRAHIAEGERAALPYGANGSRQPS
ncbi:MAG: GntR family transcriptional regulator [Gammaproteobacteria bacterium]|nr:MAG: GntR family transcriptional regulator [Gammaproteobacteria bacterium]